MFKCNFVDVRIVISSWLICFGLQFACSAEELKDIVQKCSQEPTEFATTYCYLSSAKISKSKTFCNLIKYLPDRYTCYADVAAIVNDSSLCYEIPFSVPNSAHDIKNSCYKNILGTKVCSQTESPADFVKRCNTLTENKSTIERLCTCGITTSDFETPFSGIINKCGDYYRVAAIEVVDLPAYLINKNGEIIATCGGMPTSDGSSFHNEKCDIPCSNKDLCKDTTIDCSGLLNSTPSLNSATSYQDERIYYQQKICNAYWGRTKQWDDAQMETCKQINIRRKQQ